MHVMQIDEKTRKKAWILLILVIIAMLLPMKILYKDGGTVQYKALLYCYTQYHSLTVENYRAGYRTGKEIKIFGLTVYDDTEFVANHTDDVLSPVE